MLIHEPHAMRSPIVAEGLITGIRWDLPVRLVKDTNNAIAAEDWNANVKISWESTHIQPTGITIAEAKSGKRPS